MDHYDDDYSGRSRWLRFGALGLSSIVLAVAAFGIGRLSAPLNGGQRVVVSPQNGPGPTRVENGVPVGYAHTQDGAVAAATNYLMVVNGPLITESGRYQAAVNVLAAPGAGSKLKADAATFGSGVGLTSYHQQGRNVVFRSVPLAYHVDNYTTSTADISIWTEALFAVDAVVAPHEVWETVTCRVRWVANDWKLDSIADYSGGSQGPVPVASQPSVQAAQLPKQMTDFRSYRVDVAP